LNIAFLRKRALQRAVSLPLSKEAMEETVIATGDKAQSGKQMATVVYALFAASFVIGITGLVGIVLAHIKHGEYAGTVAGTHLRWLIRTFWYGLLWTVVGGITMIILIGWLILVGAGIWTIYRIVKGYLCLLENKPMYV
jgi:uncharacterized membrane protein